MGEDESGSFGLAFDGDCVVVDLRNYRFPDRCLITGEPAEGDHRPMDFYTFKLLLSELETALDVKDAVNSKWSIGPLSILSIGMRTPLMVPHQKRSSVPGLCLLNAGIVTSILGAAMVIVGNIVWQWPLLSISIPLLVGAAMVVTGVRLLIRLHEPLSIRRFLDGYVWLGGVHPSLRDALPPWQESASARAHRRRLLRNQLGLGGLVLAVGLLYSAFQYKNVSDGIASGRWPATQGKITSSVLTARTSGGGKAGPRRTEFEVQVVYSYTVAGIGYSGSRMQFGRAPGFPDRQLAKIHQERYYSAGKAVSVYYSEGNPADCTLAPATTGEMLTLIAPMVVALVFGASCLIVGVNTLRWERRFN